MTTRSRKPASRQDVATSRPAGRGLSPQALRVALAAGLVALVAVAAVVTLVLASGDNDSGGSSAAPEVPGGVSPGPGVAATGRALPAFSGSGVDPAVGTIAPVLTGPDVNGTGTVTVEASGRPVLIGVFAHWCPHCQAELPVAADLLAEGVFDGIDVYGVSTALDESRGNWPPADWFEREGFNAPVVSDDEAGTLLTALGTRSFPSWVVLDGDGVVLQRLSGELGEQALRAVADAARAAG